MNTSDKSEPLRLDGGSLAETLDFQKPSIVHGLFGGGGVHHVAHFGHLVAGKSSALSMLTDHLLVGRAIDAVDLVVGNVAVHPLDLRPKVFQHRTGRLRRLPEVFGPKLAGARHFTLDYVLGHPLPPYSVVPRS